MERYVNEGSPSGYSFSYTSSPFTEPRSSTCSFSLIEALPKSSVQVHNLGNLPLSLFSDEAKHSTAMLIHPDMKNEKNLSRFCGDVSNQTLFLVQPTSSARTVEILNNASTGFLKLHYENFLGRIRRQLTLKHAQSAMENTQILDQLVSQRLLPKSFTYYPEVGARVFENNQENNSIYWGMVWRPFEIRGSNADKVIYQIPGFSLFARDLYDPLCSTILQQLGEVHCNNRVRFLIDDLLIPLINNYFAMLLNGGLQGEWHAQNVLFGFDENWNCISTILRDMESIDRDLAFISNTNIKINLESYPYKCVKVDQNYAIRHSFMFDYKFGIYLLAPLIDHAGICWGIDTSLVDSEITDFVMEQLNSLPKDFFPKNGCWYSFAKQLIDQSSSERPYVCNQNPRFRRA